MIECKNCKSTNTTKKGIVRKKQRYKCKDCGYNFVVGNAYTSPKKVAKKALLARLRALSRRKAELVLVFGDVSLNPNTLYLYCVKSSYKLTLKESQLFELLMINKGITVSKNTIIEKLWGYDSEAEDNNVEAYVSFLRKKLSAAGSKTTIKTLRGVGYCIMESGDN